MKKENYFGLFCVRHIGILVMAFVCFVVLMGDAAYAAFAPSQVIITSPRYDSVVKNFTVRWKSVRGAKSYQVCIGAPNCTFSRRVKRTSIRYSIAKSPLNTMKGKRVHVSVRACAQTRGGTVINSSLVSRSMCRGLLFGYPCLLTVPRTLQLVDAQLSHGSHIQAYQAAVL